MTDLPTILQAPEPAQRWLKMLHLGSFDSIGDSTSLTLLTQALADTHPFVRWQAGRLLAQSAAGQQKLLDVLQGNVGSTWSEQPQLQAAAADALSDTTAAAVDQFLTQALQADDATLRQSAAEALARRKSEQALPALIATLKDPEMWVRRAAAYALGHLGQPQAVAPLIAALNDSSVIVRRSVVYALGALRADTALPQLRQLLTNADPVIRRNAAWAIGRLGAKEAVPALSQLLADSALEGSVAVTAQQAIEAITKPRWLQILVGVRGRMQLQSSGPV